MASDTKQWHAILLSTGSIVIGVVVDDGRESGEAMIANAHCMYPRENGSSTPLPSDPLAFLLVAIRWLQDGWTEHVRLETCAIRDKVEQVTVDHHPVIEQMPINRQGIVTILALPGNLNLDRFFNRN